MKNNQHTWYGLELAVDDGAGMRATVWKESEPGTRSEARFEMRRGQAWTFHAWGVNGVMSLDEYAEQTPAQSGADSRIVGQHYEYDSVSAQTTKRYYVGGRLIATRTGSSVRYVHADHLGSTTTLTNESEKMGREWAGWIGSDRNMRTSDPAHPLYPRPSFLTRLGNNV